MTGFLTPGDRVIDRGMPRKKRKFSMPDHVGRFPNGRVWMAAAIGIFGLGLTGLGEEVRAQSGTGIALEIKRLPPREINDRGIGLRAELDNAFKDLPDGGKAGHAEEFTAAVRPYISAGMALEDAEAILRAAGLSEPPRPGGRETPDRNGGTEPYAVVAEIPQFSGHVFGNVEAYVMLVPPEQELAEFVGRRHRLMYYPRP